MAGFVYLFLPSLLPSFPPFLPPLFLYIYVSLCVPISLSLSLSPHFFFSPYVSPPLSQSQLPHAVNKSLSITRDI